MNGCISKNLEVIPRVCVSVSPKDIFENLAGARCEVFIETLTLSPSILH